MKIPLSDEYAVEAVLKAANGRATSHVITTVAELNNIVRRVVAQLDELGIPVEDRAGAKILFVGKSPYGRRVTYTANVSEVWLLIGPDGCSAFLTSFDRIRKRSNRELRIVSLRDDAHARWMARIQAA